jgi:hypothetical protein
MLVYLADQADLSAAAAISDWNARGEAVYAILRDHAALSQADLLQHLRAQGYQPRSFWIVNAIAVRGDRALATGLASQPNVGVVAAISAISWIAPPLRPLCLPNGDRLGRPKNQCAPGLGGLGRARRGNCRRQYRYGGLFHPHHLAPRLPWLVGNGISHDYNWYDPTNQPFGLPNDTNGHGTHTMGTIAGAARELQPLSASLQQPVGLRRAGVPPVSAPTPTCLTALNGCWLRQSLMEVRPALICAPHHQQFVGRE